MAGHREQQPENFQLNPFTAIGKDWMLVCAANAGKTNAMTAAWGGFGVMWRKNVAFVVLRPQRYTKEFVDASDAFSLNFFGSARRETMNYFGTVSGRDEDKIAKSGLTLASGEAAPYFAEAHTAVICKKLFAQPYAPESFLAKELITDLYPDNDFHTLYIAEVVKILTV